MSPPPPPPPPPPPSFFQSYNRPFGGSGNGGGNTGSGKPVSPSTGNGAAGGGHNRTSSVSGYRNHHHSESPAEFDPAKHHHGHGHHHHPRQMVPGQKCSTLNGVEYQKSKQQQPAKYGNGYATGDRRNQNGSAGGGFRECSPQNNSRSKIYMQNGGSKYAKMNGTSNQQGSTLIRQKPDQTEMDFGMSMSPSKLSNNSYQHDHLSIFDGSKKSRCILFSQIYLIIHVSITVCLIRIGDESNFIPKSMMIDLYVMYILIASLVFFLLLRLNASPIRLNGHYLSFNELTEQTPILFGAIILGFSELAKCVLELIDCVETESIIVPAVKFFYHLAFMHFLLSQIQYSDHIGLRNVAIAHLLSTQISLWLLAYRSTREDVSDHRHCNNRLDLSTVKMALFKLFAPSSATNVIDLRNNHSGTISTISSSDLAIDESVDPFQISLYILNNQFKFLSVFILITMWFSNNQSKINFIRAKLSEEEVIRSAYLNHDTRQYSVFRGFLAGTVFLVTSMVAIVFYDNRFIQYSASIFIQVMIAVISIVGLVMRRNHVDMEYPKYQINILKHHFIMFVTLFLVFIVALTNLITLLNHLVAWTTGSGDSLVVTSGPPLSVTTKFILPIMLVVNYLTMLIQVIIQSYLMRLQGKKLITMTHVFSLLAVANFALWIVEVSTIITDRNLWPVQQPIVTTTITVTDGNGTYNSVYSIDYFRNFLTMFVPINRFYASLIFFHFWKLEI